MEGNGTKRGGTYLNLSNEKHIATVCTNDFTPDQLDAGNSVQGSIECVTVCHLDYSNLSRSVHLCNKHSFVD